MRILKVIFYDNPKKTIHRCKYRTENVKLFTKDELRKAIEILEMAEKHANIY